MKETNPVGQHRNAALGGLGDGERAAESGGGGNCEATNRDSRAANGVEYLRTGQAKGELAQETMEGLCSLACGLTRIETVANLHQTFLESRLPRSSRARRCRRLRHWYWRWSLYRIELSTTVRELLLLIF